jgi:FAD/FMN-containing dehydrogenase
MDTTLLHDLDGDLIRPGDPGYDALRTTFTHARRPALIVRCRTPRDVRAALAQARTHGLPVSVRGGGHHGAGFATNDGGLVIDLSYLDAVDVVDRDRRLVRLGGGGTWGPVAKALAADGLALTAGDTADVGVGGLLLGGGIGWLARRYGLAVDNLVAAEVVTAAGDLVRASDTEHPDLFWALRGGGGNFGVVTAFELVAAPVTDVVFGTIRYPAAGAAAVLGRWAGYARSAPADLTTSVVLMPGGAPVSVYACLADTAPAVADEALWPLFQLGDALGNDLSTVPYPEILVDMSAGPGMPPGFRPIIRSAFVPELTADLVDTLVEGAAGVPMLAVDVRALGGAVDRTPPDATAFAHRGHEALLTTVLMGTGAQVEQAAPAFADLWRALEPLTTGAYANFLTGTGPDQVAAIYPAPTYRRLAAVKRAYDPDNLFRLNYNIAPEPR